MWAMIIGYIATKLQAIKLKDSEGFPPNGKL